MDSVMVAQIIASTLAHQVPRPMGEAWIIGWVAPLVVLLIVYRAPIGELIFSLIGKSKRRESGDHMADFTQPINGKRCPDVKAALIAVTEIKSGLMVIQGDISAIKEHEQGSRALLQTMHQDTREHIAAVREDIRKDVEDLRDTDRLQAREISALNERTKKL